MSKNIVVLVSGSGSNLQAIIDACDKGHIAGKVVAVISNKANVYALERARNHSIAAHTLQHTDYEDRLSFDKALAKKINEYKPDLLVLAGFMRILSAEFVEQFAGITLNIHPSLLPKYPGLHTHKRAIENNDSFHGASIHFVTAELDGGPVVLQTKVSVDKSDTPDSLASKVAEREWLIYPLAVKWFCDERLTLQGTKVSFDNIIIKSQGITYEDLVAEQLISNTN
ncbi:MAG: phosphoribosylglycinamide formyltransferase [Glaciecola sp.]